MNNRKELWSRNNQSEPLIVTAGCVFTIVPVKCTILNL